MHDKAALRRELLGVLKEMGPENIWRDVFDENGNKLASGHEDFRSTTPDDLAAVDYRGKTVLDLGCNLGTYAFIAGRRGAVRVVGVDSDALPIRACGLLSELYGLEGMEFRCGDFIREPVTERFDIVQLINFIGRRSLVKGIQPLLDVCRNSAREQLILSIRRTYPIRRGLSVEPEQIITTYGSRYVKDGIFDAAAFVQEYLAVPFQQISPEYEDTTLKRTFLFSFS
jgi:SAM-dependent methyltransferase